MIRHILLTGGGTAGSVTPLIAVAEAIKKKEPLTEFLFVGTDNGPERVLADAAGIPFRAIPAGKLRRYWSWRNVSDVAGLLRGFQAAQKIIASWGPDTIMSAGAYVAVPVVWAGRRAGCKILVHQQDVRPGLANRLMTPVADIISVTFPKSLNDFPAAKVRLTGNPVRPVVLEGSAEQAQKIFHLLPDVPVLVIVGGGTGSNFLNQITAVAIHRLIPNWQIIHLTGTERKFVELSDPRYHRFDFLTSNLPHALAAATVVVSRAGLGVMTELAALGKATIFVPMPGTHQEENAQYLVERQAGMIVPQAELTPDRLIKLINQLLDHPDQRATLSRNIHALYQPTALSQLTELVLGLVPNR